MSAIWQTTGQIIQTPVELVVTDFECVLLQELALGRQDVRFDQPQHGALDGTAARIVRHVLAAERLDEFRLAPAE